MIKIIGKNTRKAGVVNITGLTSIQKRTIMTLATSYINRIYLFTNRNKQVIKRDMQSEGKSFIRELGKRITTRHYNQEVYLARQIYKKYNQPENQDVDNEEAKNTNTNTKKTPEPEKNETKISNQNTDSNSNINHYPEHNIDPSHPYKHITFQTTCDHNYLCSCKLNQITVDAHRTSESPGNKNFLNKITQEGRKLGVMKNGQPYVKYGSSERQNITEKELQENYINKEKIPQNQLDETIEEKPFLYNEPNTIDPNNSNTDNCITNLSKHTDNENN